MAANLPLAFDSVRPLGLDMVTMSASILAFRSSTEGITAMPWAEGRTAKSTNRSGLMKPRGGPSAVTTAMRSPTVGSSIQCTEPELASGTRTMARPSGSSERSMSSGRLGASTISPMVTIQLGPSLPIVVSRGWSKVMRIDWELPERVIWLSTTMSERSLRTARRSIGRPLSNTIQRSAPRRKTAAGVSASKGKTRRMVLPMRRVST